MSCATRPRFFHATVTPGSMRIAGSTNELSIASTPTSGYEPPDALPRRSTTFGPAPAATFVASSSVPIDATIPSNNASASANPNARPNRFTMDPPGPCGDVTACCLARGAERRCQLDERADAVARPALGDVAVVGRGARGPGDVEVRPRHVARELLEEETRGERAAVRRGADVAQVGD